MNIDGATAIDSVVHQEAYFSEESQYRYERSSASEQTEDGPLELGGYLQPLASESSRTNDGPTTIEVTTRRRNCPPMDEAAALHSSSFSSNTKRCPSVPAKTVNFQVSPSRSSNKKGVRRCASPRRALGNVDLNISICSLRKRNSEHCTYDPLSEKEVVNSGSTVCNGVCVPAGTDDGRESYYQKRYHELQDLVEDRDVEISNLRSLVSFLQVELKIYTDTWEREPVLQPKLKT